MSEESHVVGRRGRDAGDRPAFSVRAMLCESAQVMLGEVSVQGGVRRTFCSSSFPFRISRVGVAAFMYIHYAPSHEEHTLAIRMRDSDDGDLPLGPRRADRSDLTDAGREPIHRVEFHFRTRRAFDPSTAAEPMRLPLCANFVDLSVDRPGTYYFGLAIDEIELCRAPFLLDRRHSAHGYAGTSALTPAINRPQSDSLRLGPIIPIALGACERSGSTAAAEPPDCLRKPYSPCDED